MNITRNNYEEYFLLYADGELNASDKQAVDRFISLHPDLAEELDMLMETVLDTTEITMPGKHLLFKTEEWAEENLTPQQQDLLLLLDKELPAEKATELFAAIDKDPLLQKDWSVLQQTQLPEAIIEMPEKESLYRHERNRKPIPITWVRWMAAAAVVTGLGWYSIALWNGRQVNRIPDVASVTEAGKNTSVQPIPAPQVEPSSSNKKNTSGSSIVIDPSPVNTGVSAVAIKPVKTPKTGNPNQQISTQKEESTPTYTKVVKQQPVVETGQEVTIPTNTLASVDPKEITDPSLNTSKDNPALNGSAIPTTIAYNEDSADEPEYVNIAGARIKKQKLRGIFRNVTRTVGRTFDKSNVAQADVASLNK